MITQCSILLTCLFCDFLSNQWVIVLTSKKQNKQVVFPKVFDKDAAIVSITDTWYKVSTQDAIPSSVMFLVEFVYNIFNSFIVVCIACTCSPAAVKYMVLHICIHITVINQLAVSWWDVWEMSGTITKESKNIIF